MSERLLARPGFLVRRLHQVHSVAFYDECARFGVTPVQYSVMTVLAEQPGIDQRGAAAAVAVDRFVMADVARRLAPAGMLTTLPASDRRARALHLTAQGRAVHAAMRGPAKRAHDDLVAPLPPGQRVLFLRLLRRLVDHHTAVAEARPNDPAALVRTVARKIRTPRAAAARANGAGSSAG